MEHKRNPSQSQSTEIGNAIVDSVTLARLIDEVRVEQRDLTIARSYDRTHNRHNR